MAARAAAAASVFSLFMCVSFRVQGQGGDPETAPDAPAGADAVSVLEGYWFAPNAPIIVPSSPCSA